MSDMSCDPEAMKVKEWRHTIQRAFLSRLLCPSPSPEDMAGMDMIFTSIEQYDKMTVDYLSFSKIGKIIRKINELPHFPSDEKYHFRKRAGDLVTKWQQLISLSEGNNNLSAEQASVSAQVAI